MSNIDNEYDENHPCESCDSSCDGWEAQFCCRRCQYDYDGNTPCDRCDPMDI